MEYKAGVDRATAIGILRALHWGQHLLMLLAVQSAVRTSSCNALTIRHTITSPWEQVWLSVSRVNHPPVYWPLAAMTAFAPALLRASCRHWPPDTTKVSFLPLTEARRAGGDTEGIWRHFCEGVVATVRARDRPARSHAARHPGCVLVHACRSAVQHATGDVDPHAPHLPALPRGHAGLHTARLPPPPDAGHQCGAGGGLHHLPPRVRAP